MNPKFTKKRLNELKTAFSGKRVAVVGDMMLDCYYWGKVKRISPEAPVPVVEVDDEFFRFGGAANVALNILKLGGIPVPIGVIGEDNDSRFFKKLLNESGITDEGIICDSARPTTTKTRVIAGSQHVVRIDKESKEDIHSETENKLLQYFESKADELDALILEDYNKGVLTKTVIKELIEIANRKGLVITVDPKFHNFFEYKNVTVFKPNKKETEEAFGVKFSGSGDLDFYGNKLMDELKSRYVMITLGEAGMALFGDNSSKKQVPTKARKVADVSGAGDTVISTLTMALVSGADITEAAYLANFAGGLVCGEVGIVPIESEVLFREVMEEL